MRRTLWLVLALWLAACSSGGDDITTVPVLPWGSFRHDNANSGVGSSGINQNRGAPRLLAALGEVTASTPAVDRSGKVYVGTANGLIALDSAGSIRWTFDQCDLSDGDGPCPSATCVAVGAISASPSVTPDGLIVVGSEGTGEPGSGYVFALQERGSTDVECLWMFRPANASGAFSVRSSSPLQVDALDLSLLSAFVATSDGFLQALNVDGSARWSFPSGSSALGDITSTPALSAAGVLYVAAPNGLLYAVDLSGRLLWQFPIGTPPEGAPLLPSPAVSTTAYAIGTGGSVFGINPDGKLKWQFSPQQPIPGSPAFAAQTFDEGADSEFDTIVYVVDQEGTVYGVRDLTGSPLQLQRCSLDPTQTCRTDSCLPDEGTCESGRCTISEEACTGDSCLPNNGTCTAVSAVGPIASGPVPVENSLVVSADLFAVVATADGQICARALDGTVPGDDDEPTNPWLDGCIALGTGQPARSSPAIGSNGLLYVTTDDGLYVIE